MDTLELIETIRTEEASRERLFGDAGVGFRAGSQPSPRYLQSLAEAARLYERALNGGRRDMLTFAEAMSTSDFPSLFGDILDRQLLGAFREYPSDIESYIRTSLVPDFRTAKRFSVDGAEGVLSEVAELTEYPAASVDDNADSLSVKKYGRRLHLSWETFVNDDLDAFRRLPDSLARAARRSELKYATQLFVDASGPHASLYTVGFANKVTSNPVLSLAALQTAWSNLLAMKDADNEPIFVESVTLVVPPSLEIVANNIVNALQVEMVEAGGTANQKIIAKNWMTGRIRVVVNPYIPIVASTANGATSWFLFADPQGGRAAVELGFLRGHREPALFRKAPNAVRIGGQGLEDDMADFDTDSGQYKVRHVFGGARLTNTYGYKTTVASNGSGA